MSRFTEALVVTPLADGNTWVIVRPFGYDVGREGSGDRIDVRMGFMTDFGSIPRLFWIALPKWGKYGNAAVIHDCSTGRSVGPGRARTGSFAKAWRCWRFLGGNAWPSTGRCAHSGGSRGRATAGIGTPASTASCRRFHSRPPSAPRVLGSSGARGLG